MSGCSFCGAAGVVQWTRRPNAAELAAHVAVVQEWRDGITLLADPQEPAPEFAPLPKASDTAVSVYACAAHAIQIDLAAFVHSANCTAPNPDNLPNCDCTPEPIPADSVSPITEDTLPASWQR